MTSEPDIRYPLHWLVGWPRTKFPQSTKFDRARSRTFAQARDELIHQLELLGATSILLSTNIPLRQDGLPYSGRKQPDDRGVAVYFQLSKEPRVLACDSWDRVIDNAWAIVKHVDSMRGQRRWGVGSLEQAFAGYPALPEAASPRTWYEVLGVTANANWEEVKAAYRKLAKTVHPDVGGNRAQWDAVQQAYDEAEYCFGVKK